MSRSDRSLTLATQSNWPLVIHRMSMRAWLLLARSSSNNANIWRVIHSLLCNKLRSSITIVIYRLSRHVVDHIVTGLSCVDDNLRLASLHGLRLVFIGVLQKLESITDLAFVEAIWSICGLRCARYGLLWGSSWWLIWGVTTLRSIKSALFIIIGLNASRFLRVSLRHVTCSWLLLLNVLGFIYQTASIFFNKGCRTRCRCIQVHSFIFRSFCHTRLPSWANLRNLSRLVIEILAHLHWLQAWIFRWSYDRWLDCILLTDDGAWLLRVGCFRQWRKRRQPHCDFVVLTTTATHCPALALLLLL